MTHVADHTVRVEHCLLTAVDQPWPFALERAAEIEAHWLQRSAENPKFFNGRLRMLSSYALAGDTLTGECLETDFKQFLYWRETGEPDAGVTDVFASALIWSSDGYLLLGRQTPGNINAGLTYLPGGFIDPRDVGGDGQIDIAASSEREVAEETGLGPDVLTRQPGFLLGFCGNQLSIAVEYCCALTADATRERARAHLAQDRDPELADVVLVRQHSDLAGVAMPAYAQLLLASVLT